MKHLISSVAGYTLLEVLLVVLLVSVIAVVSTSFLYTSLAGSGKAAAVAVVKQNGDHAIGVIERMARAGATCIDVGPGNDELVVGNITFRIMSDSGVNRIAQDDGVSVTYLSGSKLQASGFDCTVVTSPDSPDFVSVTLTLQFGDPSMNRVTEYARETFSARVAVRRYTR